MMKMSNSSLVSHTNISPNRNSPRNHAIDTITIHCVVGQCSVETLGNIFKPSSRQASSNYGIGTDGRIGIYVEEKDRSWCTSSSANDNRAVTIEVASDTTAPYAVNAKAYAALIELVTDICKRNSVKKLLWKGDKSLIGQPDKQNMTVHRWFANKSCPGDYLYERLGAIADEVNRRLGVDDEPTTTSPTAAIKAGDTVSLAADATYYTGKAIPKWVKSQNWIVKEVKGDRAVIDKNISGTNAICSPVNTKFLTVVGGASPTYATYTVVKGDSLWGIANKKLGNGERYPEIKALNGLTSNTIYAGQVLKLPK
jgi:LysM repeat protein